MAGGKFDKLAGKVRPGTYVNFESTRNDMIGASERGVVLLPLFNHTYGPAGEFLTITGAAIDAEMTKLGYSVYDDNAGMLLIREALKNASTVITYITKEGAKAKATATGPKPSEDEPGVTLTATAMYGGSRGNDLRFSCVANPAGGFDVSVYLGTETMAEYESLTTIEELIAQNDEWITFTGAGALFEVAGLKLEGGVDGVAANADITQMLDKAEGMKWNTLAFPLENSGGNTSLYDAVVSKIKYLREETGKYRKAVLPGHYADYEGIINVTNSVVLTDGTELTTAQATAWVAGVDAGAANTTSNTYAKYTGAVGIVNPKNHAEAVAAIKKGEFFFSFSEEGDVVVEYDINSLVSFGNGKDETYRKNRVLRVLDSFGEMVMLNFPPNRYDNSPTGWDVMEGLGCSLLKQFEDAGAIKNVDYDNDFLVDRSASTGDQTYFQVGLEAVDSAEKLYFTVGTR